MKCIQCESEKITLNVQLSDGAHKLPIIAQTRDNPDATFFKGTRSYRVHANICSDCGYLMLTLPQSDAKKVYETHANR